MKNLVKISAVLSLSMILPIHARHAQFTKDQIQQKIEFLKKKREQEKNKYQKKDEKVNQEKSIIEKTR